jgi:putative lipoic acid-binding regulatory protein
MTSEVSLLEYPAPFPLKIMGEAGDELETLILEIVRRHDTDFSAERVERRSSSRGRYLCLTCTVTATSRAMLDNLYRELSAHPRIRYVL